MTITSCSPLPAITSLDAHVFQSFPASHMPLVAVTYTLSHSKLSFNLCCYIFLLPGT